MTDPATIDALRLALLRDEAAHAAMTAEYDPARFASVLADWATANRVPFDGDALTAPSRMPLQFPDLPGEAWLPGRIDVAADRVDWLCFAGIEVGQPFYEEAVGQARSRPFNRFMRVATGLRELISSVSDPVAPAGLVLHMSRCGSTLAARMIGALPGVRAVAEPQPIDAIVRAAGLDEDRKVAALRAVAHALGRGARRTVLKLDSWHAAALPLLRRAFPDTPWAFLYRAPEEVIVSHLAMRGVQTVPGLIEPELLDIPPDDDGADPAESIARAVGGICRAVVRHWDLGGGVLVDYPALPDAVGDRLLPHFGLMPDPAVMARMGSENAKFPGEPFVPDGAAKRARVDASVRAAAARHVTGPVAALDAIRMR